MELTLENTYKTFEWKKELCACKYQNNSDNLKESLADKRKLKENAKENTRLSSS